MTGKKPQKCGALNRDHMVARRCCLDFGHKGDHEWGQRSADAQSSLLGMRENRATKKLRNDPDALYEGLAAYYATPSEEWPSDEERDLVALDWQRAESRLMDEIDRELRKRP